VSPQLDAASVEVSKFLPTQQKNGAKHFDVEQLALAAATASKDRAVLEVEVRGPTASHLVYACDRLCSIVGKNDEASTTYLFNLLIELPDKRRKALIKALIKHSHSNVLDRYVAHIADSKDLYPQLATFLHGCSHDVVVQYLVRTLERQIQAHILHFARYHSSALLDAMEAQLKQCDRELQSTHVWGQWASWLSQSALRTTRAAHVLFLQSGTSARVLHLATVYPARIKYNVTFYPTMPEIIRTNWNHFTKFHGDALFDLAQKCVYPLIGYNIFTFSVGSLITKRDQMFKFLEAAIPSSVNSSITEQDQITVTDIFTSAAVSTFHKITYMPDLLEHVNKLCDWAERYAAKYPAISARRYWLKSRIFSAALALINSLRTSVDQNMEVKHKEALERLRIDGKSFKNINQAMIQAKPINFAHFEAASIALYNKFMPEVEADLVALAKLDKKKNLDYRETQRFDETFSFANSFITHVNSIENVQVALKMLRKHTWSNSTYHSQWTCYYQNLWQSLWTMVEKSEKVASNNVLKYSPQQLKKIATNGKEAWKICFEMVSNSPVEWEDHIMTVLSSLGGVSWELIQPFWKLLKVERFVEWVKDGKEETVIEYLKKIPTPEAQPILAALFEPKVCIPAQRTKLLPFLSIADAKTRKTFEQGTSSSSAGERIAALIRMVRSTVALPFSDHGRYHGEHLNNPDACQASLKESTNTLSFIIKRIKNATFQDRVIFQGLAFEKRSFGPVWLAPGVGPTQFALWYEMLDDHLQNPNQSMHTLTIEDGDVYSNVLEDYGFNIYSNNPLSLWDTLIERALSLGLNRDNDELLDFAFELAAKIGTVESGAGDPLGTRINYEKVAAFLVTLRDSVRSNAIIEKLKLRVQKYCVAPELKPLKVDQLLRKLIESFPIVHLQFVSALHDHIKLLYKKDLAELKSRSILDILKPPTLPNGFEDEAEQENLAQRAIIPSLLEAHKKKIWRVPVLVEWVFNVAMKSWAAGSYVDIAWAIRLQSAFNAHKCAFTGPLNQYRKPLGDALRKFEMGVASKFARELVAICPSALHLPRIQRIFSYANPSVLFTHITTECENLDEITNEEEKLIRMQKAALLGPFCPTGMAAGAVVSRVAEKSPMERKPSRGRAMMRGGRGRGRGGRGGRGGGRAVPVSIIESSISGSSLSSIVVAKLAGLRDIVKKWRRGQSTKSNDNTSYFLPTLCYGTMAWHASQISSLGNGLYQAILNPMRSLAAQKKFTILWSLLPTTTYADIVIFLQQNDFNFQPSTAVGDVEEDLNVAGDGEEASSPSAVKMDVDKKEEPKLQLPLAVVESAIRGTTMNDEPLAPLPFLLSPTFLSSNYSRTAVQAVQFLMSYVPGGLLTNALAYLLKDHRTTLKTTAHKQIIRFLSEHVCVEHWDIFISEWQHPKTHRDVRITILTAAFQALNVSKGEVLDRVWRVLEMVTTHREADVVCALLKAKPTPGPKRYSPVSQNHAAVLLNTRTKNQFISFTETAIPSECAPRYLKNIVMPLLAPETITHSDLQFLAFQSLTQWASYLDETNPGEPDYARAASLLADYLIMSIESGGIWESDKRKELLIAVERWTRIAQTFMWILGYDQHSSSRKDNISNTFLKSAEYIIPDAAKMLSTVVTKLVKIAEAYNNPPVSPKDEIPFKRFGNVTSALQLLINETYHTFTVAKGNATIDEQETWLAPIRKSSFTHMFEKTFCLIEINQHETIGANIDKWFASYTKVVPVISKNKKIAADIVAAMTTWLQYMPVLSASTPFIKRLLSKLKDRQAGWKTKSECMTDVYCTYTLSFNILNHYANYASRETLLEDFINFLEYVLKLHAGLEVIVPGFARLVPNLVYELGQLLSTFVSSSYYNTSTYRKRFMEWIVSRALEVQKAYTISSQPSINDHLYASLWRSLLATISGETIALYCPKFAGDILDAAAFLKEGMSNMAVSIVNHWTSPYTNLADSALDGVGTPGVDTKLAVELMERLITVKLNPKRLPSELTPVYVNNVLDAASTVLSNSINARLLSLEAPDLWWQAFNQSFARQVNLPFDTSTVVLTNDTTFLSSAIDPYRNANEELYDTSSAIDLINRLDNGTAATVSLAPAIEALYPFASVADDYLELNKRFAMDLLIELGPALALTPPKDKGSSKKTWRPELAQLCIDINASASVADRSRFAAEALAFTTIIFPTEEGVAPISAATSSSSSSK
jgi:hypothetical protein